VRAHALWVADWSLRWARFLPPARSIDDRFVIWL
jgi:hypothetical protein